MQITSMRGKQCFQQQHLSGDKNNSAVVSSPDARRPLSLPVCSYPAKEHRVFHSLECDVSGLPDLTG